MTFPTFPITVSPEHCIGSFNYDGTQMTITMKTSNNRTVTSGYVGFRNNKIWNNNQVFLPDPLQRLGSGVHNVKLHEFVVDGRRYPSLD